MLYLFYEDLYHKTFKFSRDIAETCRCHELHVLNIAFKSE